MIFAGQWETGFTGKNNDFELFTNGTAVQLRDGCAVPFWSGRGLVGKMWKAVFFLTI